MYIDIKKILSLTTILAVGALLGIIGLLTYQKAKAPKQLITVTGSAEVDAVTDQANISVQVKNTGTTQEAAQTANKKDVDTLKKALAKLGVPESRITQSTYSQPAYIELDQAEGMIAPDFMPRPKETTTPTAVTSLSIVLDSLENIGEVLSVISENPNTQVSNTYYSLNHRQDWESKAKEAALKDARDQIEKIAKTNKLKVGKLTYLKDLNDGGDYEILPMYREKGAMSPDDSSSLEEPTNTGVVEDNVFYSEQSVKITASYQARYELY
jgi:uncharacterized protein YggE